MYMWACVCVSVCVCVRRGYVLVRVYVQAMCACVCLVCVYMYACIMYVWVCERICVCVVAVNGWGAWPGPWHHSWLLWAKHLAARRQPHHRERHEVSYHPSSSGLAFIARRNLSQSHLALFLCVIPSVWVFCFTICVASCCMMRVLSQIDMKSGFLYPLVCVFCVKER